MKTIQQINFINRMSDQEVLARTLWGEARGECTVYDRPVVNINDTRIQGIVAISNVIINRLKQQTWYGSNIRTVCLKPYQFSCWNDDDPNLKRLLAVDCTNRIYRACLFVAKNVFDDQVQDITKEADHYYARSMKKEPSWAKFATLTVKIGRHNFYKMGSRSEI